MQINYLYIRIDLLSLLKWIKNVFPDSINQFINAIPMFYNIYLMFCRDGEVYCYTMPTSPCSRYGIEANRQIFLDAKRHRQYDQSKYFIYYSIHSKGQCCCYIGCVLLLFGRWHNVRKPSPVFSCAAASDIDISFWRAWTLFTRCHPIELMKTFMMLCWTV